MLANHFRECYVRPVLKHLDRLIPYSKEAEDLIVLTACVESNMGKYAKQEGSGPALSLLQIEPETELDNIENYLQYRPDLEDLINHFAMSSQCDDLNLLNPFYAVAHARIKYYRDDRAIPREDTLLDFEKQSYIYDLANYWKEIYNSRLGAGTINHFVECAYEYGDIE